MGIRAREYTQEEQENASKSDISPLKGDISNREDVNYISSNLKTEKKEAIEFADYLLGNFEMAEFEKEHPKYKVDDELCWQLAGTQQKYTSVEMYEIFLKENYNIQKK